MKRAALALGLVCAMGAAGCTALEDAVFNRAIRAMLGGQPEPIDGMRVVVCGSASPLGNTVDRAQACIAVLTPEHFLLFDVGARSPVRT